MGSFKIKLNQSTEEPDYVMEVPKKKEPSGWEAATIGERMAFIAALTGGGLVVLTIISALLHAR